MSKHSEETHKKVQSIYHMRPVRLARVAVIQLIRIANALIILSDTFVPAQFWPLPDAPDDEDLYYRATSKNAEGRLPELCGENECALRKGHDGGHAGIVDGLGFWKEVVDDDDEK